MDRHIHKTETRSNEAVDTKFGDSRYGKIDLTKIITREAVDTKFGDKDSFITSASEIRDSDLLKTYLEASEILKTKGMDAKEPSEKIALSRVVRILALLEDNIRGLKIIDVGCGSPKIDTGRGFDYEGSDYAPRTAEILQSEGADVTGVDVRKNLQASYKHVQADLDQEGWTGKIDSEYDLTVCVSLFDAPDSPFFHDNVKTRKLLNQLRGITQDNGVLYVSAPQSVYFADESEQANFFEQAGFDVIASADNAFFLKKGGEGSVSSDAREQTFSIDKNLGTGHYFIKQVPIYCGNGNIIMEKEGAGVAGWEHTVVQSKADARNAANEIWRKNRSGWDKYYVCPNQEIADYLMDIIKGRIELSPEQKELFGRMTTFIDEFKIKYKNITERNGSNLEKKEEELISLFTETVAKFDPEIAKKLSEYPLIDVFFTHLLGRYKDKGGPEEHEKAMKESKLELYTFLEIFKLCSMVSGLESNEQKRKLIREKLIENKQMLNLL